MGLNKTQRQKQAFDKMNKNHQFYKTELGKITDNKGNLKNQLAVGRYTYLTRKIHNTDYSLKYKNTDKQIAIAKETKRIKEAKEQERQRLAKIKKEEDDYEANRVEFLSDGSDSDSN